MSWSHLERSVPVSRAIELAHQLLAAEKIECRVTTVGRRLLTTTSDLSDSKGAKTVGRGKGIGQQAYASAIFESIEHYFYEQDNQRTKVRLALDEYLAREPTSSSIVPELVARETNISLTWNKFFSLNTGSDEAFFLPAFLNNPYFEAEVGEENEWLSRKRLLRYGTNSGTASGSTIDECILHGILELIERDAVSVALLELIVSKAPKEGAVLAKLSLPCEVQDLIRAAEEEISGHIEIWDITTDIEVPAFLAQARTDLPTLHHPYYFGSGASLFADHAVERAVLEAVQCFHCYNSIGLFRPLSAGKRKRTNFGRCHLEVGIFEPKRVPKRIEYKHVAPPTGPASASSQVDLLLRKLKGIGALVYARILKEGPPYVCQVIAPHLEKFNLVAAGVPVVPGRRGRKYLT